MQKKQPTNRSKQPVKVKKNKLCSRANSKHKICSKPVVISDIPDIKSLYTKIHDILEKARRNVTRCVNTEMVRAYWLVGEAIIEYEQRGKKRAEYGEAIIQSLSEQLTAEFGKGFTTNNLWYMRQFYLAYQQKLHALRGELSWTHYRLLLKIEKTEARDFYEQEAATGHWSTRELERQISTLFYERLLLSKQKKRMVKQVQNEAKKYSPEEFIRDPYILEFLAKKQASIVYESDLEKALISHLQDFLLELGKGFAFIGRQQRITIDGDHFFVDLVFYNRLLRCFVLIDLKVGKLTHEDIGQMQLYVNYYTREMQEDWENPTIGILLCTDKNDATVRYTLPENQQQIFATQYKLYLPSEEELLAELGCQQTTFTIARKLETKPKLVAKPKKTKKAPLTIAKPKKTKKAPLTIAKPKKAKKAPLTVAKPKKTKKAPLK